MERTDILKKVNEIFWDVFDDESIEVKEETTAADIEDWDSLSLWHEGCTGHEKCWGDAGHHPKKHLNNLVSRQFAKGMQKA